MKKELLVKYGQWRRATEEGIESCNGSIDCGESIIREDFSDYLELKNCITFEEMFELEIEYEYLLDEYETTIEMLTELGYYNACNINDIKSELDNLKTLGYDCYFDSNTDRIVLDK